MEVIIDLNDEQVVLQIEDAQEIAIDMYNHNDNNDNYNKAFKPKETYETYDLFDLEVENIYKLAEASAAIQNDDGYFPINARCLVGRKLYKTFSVDRGLVLMKALLLLVKTEYGWMRTNIHLEQDADDANYWDVEFVK